MSNIPTILPDAAKDRLRKDVIAFYDKEHNLHPEERKQIAIFFDGQSYRMIYSFITCMTLGITIPLGLRRFGLKGSGPPFFGLCIGSIVNGMITNRMYYNYLDDFKKRVGESSSMFATVEVTPDPIRQAGFWAYYFRVSSENPNYRIKNPRTITNTSKFLAFEDIPETVDGNERNIKPEAVGGWHTVRSSNAVKNTEQLTQKDKQDQANFDDPFDLSTSFETLDSQKQSTPASIGDSYDPIFDSLPLPDSEQRQDYPFKVEHDQLIQPQATTESAWDRVRRESGR